MGLTPLKSAPSREGIWTPIMGSWAHRSQQPKWHNRFSLFRRDHRCGQQTDGPSYSMCGNRPLSLKCAIIISVDNRHITTILIPILRTDQLMSLAVDTSAGDKEPTCLLRCHRMSWHQVQSWHNHTLCPGGRQWQNSVRRCMPGMDPRLCHITIHHGMQLKMTFFRLSAA